MAKLKQFWTDLRSSLWFLPVLFVLAFIVTAYVLIEVDSRAHSHLVTRWPRLFAANAEGARAMLSAIATSMMTVAGVVFSITVVALAQASNQYSPRVLRNFMRDRGNQVVFGVFVGIFAYCLAVLRNIAGGADQGFVPSLAVLVGFCFALLGIALLIYFIHHIATAIQASEMVAAIAAETIAAAQKLFTERVDPDQPEQNGHSEPTGEHAWRVLPSSATGYIQRVEFQQLGNIATDRGLTFRIDHAIGDFVVRGRPLLHLKGEAEINQRFTAAINANFGIGTYRTVEQDPEFGIRQIVDIALKGLSPGINDMGTAITCLDYLSAIFCHLAPVRLEPAGIKHGNGRVTMKTEGFRTLLHNALTQIIENSTHHTAVLLHVLTTLHRISDAGCTPARQRQLLELSRLVKEAAAALESSDARVRVESRVAELVELLTLRCASTAA